MEPYKKPESANVAGRSLINSILSGDTDRLSEELNEMVQHSDTRQRVYKEMLDVAGADIGIFTNRWNGKNTMLMVPKSSNNYIRVHQIRKNY